MTVTTETRSVEYAGDGSTTVRAVPFTVLDVEHLVVTLIVDSTEVETVKTFPTHWTPTYTDGYVTSITMVTAPAVGETLRIERTVPLTQTINFRTQGTFSPETHMEAFDLGTMADQQLADDITELRDEVAEVAADVAALDTRVDALEATDANYEVRLDALEAGGGGGGGADLEAGGFALMGILTTATEWAYSDPDPPDGSLTLEDGAEGYPFSNTVIVEENGVFTNPFVFTAPVAGVYLFYVNATYSVPSSGAFVWVELRAGKSDGVTDTFLARALDGGIRSSQQVRTVSVVFSTHMDVGEVAFAVLQTHGQQAVIFGGAYSGIGGHLITPD